jgi:hypothetical protein
MAKWVILEGDTLFAQVIEDAVPCEETGYDMEGKTAVQVEEFKPLDQFRFNVESHSWEERLSEAKESAILTLNNLRERSQSKYLTPGTAKAHVYQQKQLEIMKLDDGIEHTSDNFPYAHAEAAELGTSVAAVVETYRQGRNAAVAACAEIEAEFRKTLGQIRSAESRSEIEVALTGSSLFS